MTNLFQPSRDVERVAGTAPPRDYDLPVRFESALAPDIELVKAGIRFESYNPITRIMAGESVNTSAGDLLLVESNRTSASGRRIGSTVAIDDGLGNRLAVSGAADADSVDQAASETSVQQNTSTVEAALTVTVAPTPNPVPAPDDFETTQATGPSSYEVLQAEFAAREAEKTVSSGGTQTNVVFPKPAPNTPLTTIDYAATEDADNYAGASSPSTSSGTNYLNSIEYAEFEDAFG